jgi:hypothetical protein
MDKLIPTTLLENLPKLYETEGVTDPLCHIKLFTPDSNWTWYIIEFSNDTRKIFYGYVVGFEKELGYFSLEEIESIRGILDLHIERDTSFKPTPLSVIKKGS